MNLLVQVWVSSVACWIGDDGSNALSFYITWTSPSYDDCDMAASGTSMIRETDWIELKWVKSWSDTSKLVPLLTSTRLPLSAAATGQDISPTLTWCLSSTQANGSLAKEEHTPSGIKIYKLHSAHPCAASSTVAVVWSASPGVDWCITQALLHSFFGHTLNSLQLIYTCCLVE